MSPDAQALIGQTFEGRYEILSKIGAGGMGTVYKARHLAMERDVAIKVLKHHLVHDEASRKRFVREMKATSCIDSPYTVSVHDYGTTEDGDAFLVMEFLEGKTLKELLREEGDLPLDRLLDISRQVASALGTAHENGIIHRDIKPENIILVTKFDGSDWVKVLDFGIAQIGADNTQTAPDQLTATGTVLGTPSYMSPERARGHAFDHRADLYSLGVLLFVMATGRPPYESTEPMGVLFKHITDPIPSLCDKGVTKHPDWLDDVIRALMAKNPDDRPATAADFLALLEDAVAGAPARVVADAPTQMLSTAEPPPATPADGPTATPADGPNQTAVIESGSETAKVDAVPPAKPKAKTNIGLVEAVFFLCIFAALMTLISDQFSDPLHHARTNEGPPPATQRATEAPAPAEAPAEATPKPAPTAVQKAAAAKPGRVMRRLAAVLFTDMQGFSRLMGVDEAGSLTLLRAHNAVLKQAFAANGGRVVKQLGDGFMVEFSSSVEAVLAALAAQDALAKRNASKPADQVIRVRMAIDSGDVVVEGDDLLGEVVNMASQLRRLAKPGTIAVTSNVRADVRGKVRAAGETLPAATLKGRQDKVTVHLLSPADTPLAAAAPVPAPAPEEEVERSPAAKEVDAEVQHKLRQAKTLLKKAPAQALQMATSVLAGSPGLGEAMLLSSLARTRLKQYGVALTALESCREVQPDYVPCLYELGRAYERLGKRAAAMQTYKEVVDKHPGSAEAIEARHRLAQ